MIIIDLELLLKPIIKKPIYIRKSQKKQSIVKSQ